MNTPMLEKCARALAQSVCDGVGPPIGANFVERYWPEHKDAARAVLTALLEPDEQTLVAGGQDRWTGADPSPDQVWAAMLQHILKGEGNV